MDPISQFYVLSPRGDTIIAHDCTTRFQYVAVFRYVSVPVRGDLPKGTSEVFFRNVKFWNGKQQDAPPVFNIDHVNYLYVKKSGLYFVATTKYNVSPSFVIELTQRICNVFKDYCGVLTEESIRKNFILLYELLDEMVVGGCSSCILEVVLRLQAVQDNGYPQWVSSESLKSYIFNEPIEVADRSGLKVPYFSSLSASLILQCVAVVL